MLSIRDLTDKTAENFSGHLVAPDHEFGGIFARSVLPSHAVLTADTLQIYCSDTADGHGSTNSAVLSVMSLLGN